jgi:hypothetical protein
MRRLPMRTFKFCLSINDVETCLLSRYPGPISPDDVLLELSQFHPNDLSIVILDELDRISDGPTKRLLADTIKALADEKINAKLRGL